MGDYYYGKITIPHRCLQSMNDELIKAFTEDGLDPGNYDIEGNNGELAVFEDEQARNGQFDNLEQELIKQGIPFDRNSSGYYEYLPENISFRPKTVYTEELFVTQILTNDGDPFITTPDLKKLLDGTSDYLPRAGGDVAKALELMLEDYDPDIPPLEDWLKANNFNDVLAKAVEACNEEVEVFDDRNSTEGLSG